MNKENRIAFLTSKAGKLWLHGDDAPPNITAEDFSGFKVSDSAETCRSCGPNNPLRPPAPVVIRGGHYCVWCALELSRSLLTPPVMTA
jgi:hypothetical protein